MWTWCEYVNVVKDPQGSEWITHSRPPRARDSLLVASSLACSCSRRSDLSWGQRAEMLAEKKKKKNEGWGRFRSLLSPSPSFPPYFFLALAKLHYPNAWNRLVSRGHFTLITQGKLKKPIPSSAETWIIFTNMPCQFFFVAYREKSIFWKASFLQNKNWLRWGKASTWFKNLKVVPRARLRVEDFATVEKFSFNQCHNKEFCVNFFPLSRVW